MPAHAFFSPSLLLSSCYIHRPTFLFLARLSSQINHSLTETSFCPSPLLCSAAVCTYICLSTSPLCKLLTFSFRHLSVSSLPFPLCLSMSPDDIVMNWQFLFFLSLLLLIQLTRCHLLNYAFQLLLHCFGPNERCLQFGEGFSLCWMLN